MQVFGDDGARIDVRVDGGGGSAIVLIHGFPLARDIWNEQSETLARTHRVVLPDLRGAGASSVPEGPYLMETLASDVAAALDALGIERAAIAGHSMGGYVALAFARMFSERVSHLALICSKLASDAPEVASARFELAEKTERENSIDPVISAYLPRLFASETATSKPGAIERARAIANKNDPRGAAAALRGLAMRVDSYDIAPDVAVPVLVVAGAGDGIASVQELRGVAAAFPSGQLSVCPQSGHAPMLEEPEALTQALEGWLSRT